MHELYIRYSAEEKESIILTIKRSELSLVQALKRWQGSWKGRGYTSNPPCLLSDNEPCYIASSLKEYLGKVYNIKHIHGKPLHPQTQGKIERYHRSMKNGIKLNHYFCPSELENAIDGWVKYYNERRFHESLDNLTPKDVYLGQGEKIKKIREIIKQNSINKRIFDNKTMKYQSK